MTIELNVYHTIAIAIVILSAGEAIRNRVMVLQKYCIPVPVVGGLLCTVIILIGHETGAFEIKFDMAFKDFFMLLFYSGIGFTASWKLLKKGGPQVIIFLITCGPPFFSSFQLAEEGRAASNYIPDYFLCRGCIPEPAWSGAIKADGD